MTVRYDAPAGAIIMDLYGRIIGQVVGSRLVRREPFELEIEIDIDQDADTDSMQVLASSAITGSING
jgi:hypothetical protein